MAFQGNCECIIVEDQNIVHTQIIRLKMSLKNLVMVTILLAGATEIIGQLEIIEELNTELKIDEERCKVKSNDVKKKLFNIQVIVTLVRILRDDY